jgi:hypothetical protein
VVVEKFAFPSASCNPAIHRLYDDFDSENTCILFKRKLLASVMEAFLLKSQGKQ